MGQARVDESRQALNAEPSSAPAARQQIVDFLAEHGAFRPLEAAALIVTELVTNAVRHGEGDTVEVVARLDGGALRLEVADASPALPTRRLVPTQANFGRGLALVEALSHRWGVVVEPGRGKRVWAELPR